MNKKDYRECEMHWVKVNNLPLNTDLSELPDEELLKLIKSDSFAADNRKYIANENFISREIAGETVLVGINNETTSFNGMITFNDAGLMMWKLLQKRRTETDLVFYLSNEYGANAEDVRADVQEFLSKAVERGFINICD